MMKIRFIGFIAMLFATAILTSCGGDDDGGATIPPPGGNTDDGIFITGTATSETPGSDIQMAEGAVDAFGQDPPYASRPGFFEAYLYMEAGEINITEIKDDGDTEVVWGGTTTSETIGSGTMLVSEVTEGGAAIAIASSGLYHVMLDLSSATLYIIKVEKYGLIGPAGNGWSTDIEIPLKSASADEVVFEGTNMPIKQGEFKLRYNANWNIDRSGATPAVDGLNLLTNFGTTVTGGDENGNLQPGGYNFNFSGQEGKYTVTITFTPGKGYKAAVAYERTGDLDPNQFDPADYEWGVIGTATDSAWDADVNLTYKGLDSTTHRWVGFVFLQDGEFKFRTNDAWDFALGAGQVTPTGDAAGDVSGTDNFVLDNASDSGYYYITITTSDEGSTWGVNMDAGIWGIIGDATPGDWTNSTALTYNGDNTWSATVTMKATGEYKFRANDSWDLNLGGDLSALILDGGNLATPGAGDFTVTVETANHGATYTASLQ